MSTKNIVPRVTGEGSIGTSSKNWLTAYVENLYSKIVKFNTSPTPGDHAEGKLYWDSIYKTLSLESVDDTTLQLGQETMVRIIAGEAIADGQPVYITGASGVFPTGAKAKADTEDTAYVVGLATHNISGSAEGFVVVRGIVHNVDTSGTPVSETWLAGDSLYLSPTTAGALTKVKPVAPNIQVRVGRVVVCDATVGSIYVNPSMLSTSSSTTSAGAGVEFYMDGTVITATGNQNSNVIETWSKTPSAAAESIETKTVNNNTLLDEVYLYNTALDRTSISAGSWRMLSYCGVDSAIGVSEVLANIMRVRPGAGTVKITTEGGDTTTSRTATVTGGTPFAKQVSSVNDDGIADPAVATTVDTASYLQTSAGVYRINAWVSTSVVKVDVPATYTDDAAGLTYAVHKRLFQMTTGEINAISGAAPTYLGLQLYTTNVVQPAFTTLITDKIAAYRFAKTTRTSNVVVVYAYGGTTRYSHIESPLETLHGNLPGLQGGTGTVPSEEYYHLTSAEYTGTGSGNFVRASGNTQTITKQMWTGATELTIASGVITATQSLHTVDTEGDASTDDLVTVTAGTPGQLLAIRANHTDRTIVIKETGNILCGGSAISLSDISKYVLFNYDSDLSKWVVIGGSGAGGGSTKQVNQASHGFTIGCPLYLNGAVYTKAQADTSAKSSMVGMVLTVEGINDFTMSLGGYIKDITPTDILDTGATFTAGSEYFLDEITAGKISLSEPGIITSVKKRIFIADSTTSGFFINDVGVENSDPSTSYEATFVNADLSTGVLTVNHNLGINYPIVEVWDNSNKTIEIATKVTKISSNQLTIDLSALGALTGTWRVVCIGVGATFNTGGVAIAGGTNTFNISNGTASLDVASGKTVNIDDDLTLTKGLTVTTNAGTIAFTAASKTLSVLDSCTVGGAAINATLPSFLVSCAAQDNISNGGTDVTVLFSTEIADRGSNFNIGTYTFTAPVTGLYQMNVLLNLDNADSAAYYYAYLKTSNRNYICWQDIRGLSADTATTTFMLSMLCDMDASDTALVTIRQTGGTSQADLSATSYFSGYLVC
jgi:hypothetical protein